MTGAIMTIADWQFFRFKKGNVTQKKNINYKYDP